jgi:hypothetical protein
MEPLAVVAQPFAVFFAEVCAEVRRRPRPDSIGLARLPAVRAVTDDVAKDLCVECLNPESSCCCD